MITQYSFLSLLIRVVLCFIILIMIFQYFDPINSLAWEADALNFIVFGLYVPVVFTAKTIGICIFLALPFWLLPRLYIWWSARPFLQISILLFGILLLFLSINDAFQIKNELQSYKGIGYRLYTNENISLPGWYLTAVLILTIDMSGVYKKFIKKFRLDNDWTKTPNS